MPAGAGPDFVNAAFCVQTTLDARDFLQWLHQIEARFGRERRTRWAPRTMDLDLISFGDDLLPDREIWLNWASLPPERRAETTPDQLILPHPRLQERAFVLIPLAEIAPEWHHPGFGCSVANLLEALPATEREGPRRLIDAETLAFPSSRS